MADEVIEAAARAIRILGEGALRSSAAELARLALELAAVDVGVGGVPRDNLKAAADALSQAGSAGRSEAVLALLHAATMLEGTLGVEVALLRGRASLLALKCGELRQAAEDIGEVRRATAVRAEQAVREERRPADQWWWMLFRGWLPRRPGSDNLEAALLVNDQDALIAVEFMSKQSAQLENLLEVEKIAHEIQQLADHLDFSHHNLDQATAAVMVVDNAGAAFVAAIVELGTAATQLEREATVQLHTLRAPMVQLADACREHGEGAKAMQAVQLAADERARQRGAAAGTSQNERPQVPGPVQGDELSSECSAMQGTALLGALTMLPYMGGPKSSGLLDPKLYSCRRSIGIGLAWVWCIVGAGVPCLLSKRPLLQRIARLLGRVGMLAVTLLVILYCYWSLVPDWAEGWLWGLVTSAALVHVILFGLAWSDGDL